MHPNCWFYKCEFLQGGAFAPEHQARLYVVDGGEQAQVWNLLA
jgi:hypothetical protein